MKKEKFKKLVEKYLENRATPEEEDLLFRYYQELQGPDRNWDESLMGKQEKVGLKIYSAILENIETGRNRPGQFKWLGMAAAIVVLFAAGLALYRSGSPAAGIAVAEASDDVSPGGNKAILTLADGSKVVLDGGAKGVVASQQGVTVTKAKNGLLIYTFTSTARDGKENETVPAYNTITTPRGGQYQVVLPDGTNVWLNSASSLKFPTLFAGAERRVELTGEAYFDVSSQLRGERKLPFTVKINTVSGDAGEVKVLGTHFNIMAYDNEKNVATSLFEGSVVVKKGGQERLLKPGQQAVAAKAEHAPLNLIDGIDAGEILAWKNGQFSFSNADIGTILRQIGRWYDIEIEIMGKLPDEGFNGKISRSENLSQVVKVLRLNGLDLKIEGRKLIVKP